MAFRRMYNRYRTRARSYYRRARSYATRGRAIASMPYLAGAAVGFTGIADRYVPAKFQNVLMIAAVAPSGLMKGKLSMVKSVAQGYIIGRVVRGLTGGISLGSSGNNGNGGW